MGEAVKLTKAQFHFLRLLYDEPQSTARLGARCGWSRASVKETAAKFCIQLYHLGLAERHGPRRDPSWSITAAGRARSLRPEVLTIGAVRMALPRAGTQRAAILKELAKRPLSSDEVADFIDDIPAHVARTMRPMCIGGLVLNANPGKGRLASWTLTDAGRQALNPSEASRGQ